MAIQKCNTGLWCNAPALFAALLLGNACDAQPEPNIVSPNIVSYVVENHGKADHDVLATFASVFAPGDVPRGSSLEAVLPDGASVPLQLDAKAFNSDGSLRHGVITLQIPRLEPDGRVSIGLRHKSEVTKTVPPIAISALPLDFDAVVTLKMKDRVLTASAKSLLAAGRVENWLSGSLVSEWWVSGAFRDAKGNVDPHMYVEFGIRSYGKDRPLRIETDVENDWTYVPDRKTEFYDAEVRANGRVIYSKTGLVQSSQTRWRLGFWWNEAVGTYVRQNLAYLKRVRVVPNYDPSLAASPEALSHLFEAFDSKSHGPMTSGILEKYMPSTGGRPDIAPLPQWQAMYLLTMDPRAYEITLVTADEGASYSSHYRNEKTRRPLTLQDYPKFSTNWNLVGHGAGQLQTADTGGYKDPLAPDAAHEPALDFIPYLITGDRFYLEELEFWAEWNLSGTNPGYRDFANGIVSWDQVRAQAWSLRTLAQAEYITPDSDPLKSVFKHQLDANVEWYEKHFSDNPQANKLGTVYNPEVRTPWDNGQGISPFEDDYFTWVVNYIAGLGDAKTTSLLRWKATFPIARMIAPGFCWVLATPYYFRVRNFPSGNFFSSFAQVYQATLPLVAKKGTKLNNLACGSAEMADAIGVQPGEMISKKDPGSYTAVLQTALAAAVDSHAPDADRAWRFFMQNPSRPDYSTEPGWDIVPRR